LLVFYFGVGEWYAYAAEQNTVNSYNKRRFDDFYATPHGLIDMLFIGSSHSYCTFDPENFDAAGIESFQLGMPLQLMDGSYFTLLEALNYQRPAAVVLDLYWYVLEMDYDGKQMEMFIDVCRNDEINRRYFAEATPINEKVKQFFRPVRFQADFMAYVNKKAQNVIGYRLGLTRTAQASPEGREYYRGRGYYAYEYIMTDAQREEIAAKPLLDMRGWRMANRQRRYLERFVALCAESEIKLIFTTAPVSPVQFGRMANYGEFHEQIAEVAGKNGIPYLNFNLNMEEAGLNDDKLFMDAGHLNDAGVKIANAFFLRWLAGLDIKI